MPDKISEHFIFASAQMGIQLEDQQLRNFEIFSHALSQWNDRFNLTAITDPAEIYLRHFLDSMTLTQAFTELKMMPPDSLLDIGSGAGFPGIPLKLIFKDLKLTLMEATGKKASFLEHVVALLGLSKVNVVHGRSEDLAHVPVYREQFDCVTARAVAALPALVELALPFCRKGGYFVAMKKGAVTDEIEEARKGAEIIGGTFVSQLKVTVPGLDDERHLISYRKTNPTPGCYPRRAGIPETRPLK